jgi:flagellin-like protein
MNIKTFLFDDDRGVSPVIGVILMVAITVILAAVIAAFVLGLGDTNSTAPSVTFEYDYESADDNVTVTVTGGETVDAARLSISGDSLGENKTEGGGSNVTLGINSGFNSQELVFLDGEPGSPSSGGFSAGEQVSAGDSFTVTTDGDDFELDIIFTSEDGGTSSRIGGTTGPDA